MAKNLPRQPQPIEQPSEHTLESALEEFQVTELEGRRTIPVGWFEVSTSDGAIAYFGSESDACRFRLAEVNRKLNP